MSSQFKVFGLMCCIESIGVLNGRLKLTWVKAQRDRKTFKTLRKGFEGLG